MPEFNEHEEKRPSEQDLLAIKRMRVFRRVLSIVATLLVLLAAILLALTSGRGDEPLGHGYSTRRLMGKQNVQTGPAACGNGRTPSVSGCDASTTFLIPAKLND